MKTNEMLVQEMKKGENYRDNLEQLYVRNLGFSYYLADLYKVEKKNLDDFLQLCYFAMENATKAFQKDSGFTFLNYYRRCMLHLYYLHRLETFFPMRLNRTQYKSLKEDGMLLRLSNSIDPDDALNVLTTENGYEQVEQERIAELIWSIVEATLTETNAYVLQERFIVEKSLTEIGHDLHIGSERVRLREKRSLKKLQENEVLREIARDYLGIKIVK